MRPRSSLMATLLLGLLCMAAASGAAAVSTSRPPTDRPPTDRPQIEDAAPTEAPAADERYSAQEVVPKAEVSQGCMRGAMLQSRSGRPIYAFRGIPYAKPPLGALRFQAPVAAGPWSGVLDATTDGSQCVQKNYLVPPYPVLGNEDCLFLNVYTPKMAPLDRTMPVVVYIHGGGFFAGSGASYFNGPQYLLDHDVVLVTMNYRLGALGFLSSGDERIPGNAGLKDQTLALRWIRHNVHVFGGDPNQVTIMGQSAGGASVHFHLLSRLSKGLFHRAISQSGTALNAWATPRDPVPIILKQAEFLDCNAVSMDDAIHCLLDADPYNLTEAGHRFKFWDIDPLTVFRPVVEAAGRPGAFLENEPAELIQMGAFSHVPWLTGSVPEEGIIRAVPILTNAELAADLNARWDEIGPRLMDLEHSIDPALEAAVWKNISDFYLGDAQPHVDISEPKPFIDLYSDRAFLLGFRRAVQLHARAGHKRIFLYEWAYRGRFSYSTLFGGGDKDFGVCHCDDLLSLFYAPAIFPEMPTPGSVDEQAMQTLTQLWVNFAKFGNPTPAIKWKKAPPPARDAESQETARAAAAATEDCWTHATEAQWAPYEPAREDLDLRFLRLEAAPRGAAGTQREAGAGALRMCMRKGFHKRRLDYWRTLPLSENKASAVPCAT